MASSFASFASSASSADDDNDHRSPDSRLNNSNNNNNNNKRRSPWPLTPTQAAAHSNGYKTIHSARLVARIGPSSAHPPPPLLAAASSSRNTFKRSTALVSLIIAIALLLPPSATMLANTILFTASLISALLAPVAFADPLPNCVEQNRVPNLDNGVNLYITQYKLQNNVLHGELRVRNIFFHKTVRLGYGTAANKWTTFCNAYYGHGPYNAKGQVSNYETWKFNCPIDSQGIIGFYVEYNTTNPNNGQVITFYGNIPGGGNFPTGPQQTLNAPSASGFSADIDSYTSAQFGSALNLLTANIQVPPSSGSNGNHPGGLPGSLAAAGVISKPRGTDYSYHWVRDAALVYDALTNVYANSRSLGDTLESLILDNTKYSARLQRIIENFSGEANAGNTRDKNGGFAPYAGKGEPKFELDGTQYFGAWCRPQVDSPAARASTYINFIKSYLAKGGSISNVQFIYNDPDMGTIKNDLDFLLGSIGNNINCDLWEETRSPDHFYTDMVLRKAFHDGVTIANFFNDTASASNYAAKAAQLDAKIGTYFDAGQQSIQAIKGTRLLDSAIVQGVLHGYNNDGVFAPNDDRVLSTIYKISSGFNAEYGLNLNSNFDINGAMAPGIGRYFGDKYDGTPGDDFRLGNPWHLATLGVAELLYRAASLYKAQGSITVTNLNQQFFTAAQPIGLGVSGLTAGTTLSANSAGFNAIIGALEAVGDAYFRRVKNFADVGRFGLPEQFGRDCGVSKSAEDLSWSYASFLTAVNARNALKQQ